MISIKKHPTHTSSVYITDLKVKVPTKDIWHPLDIPSEELENSADLKYAFEHDMIVFKVTDNDYQKMPNWYTAAYKDEVKVPTEILEKPEAEAIELLDKLKHDAHPLLLAVLKNALYTAEANQSKRPKVLKTISDLMEKPQNVRK